MLYEVLTMIIDGTVSTSENERYRIKIGGSISTPISRLTSACRLKISSPDTVELLPPAVGDVVLCWFPGDAFRDGYVIGIVEGSL